MDKVMSGEQVGSRDRSLSCLQDKRDQIGVGSHLPTKTTRRHCSLDGIVDVSADDSFVGQNVVRLAVNDAFLFSRNEPLGCSLLVS